MNFRIDFILKDENIQQPYKKTVGELVWINEGTVGELFGDSKKTVGELFGDTV